MSVDVDQLDKIMSIFERFVKLATPDNGSQVVMDGEHFRVTTVDPKALPEPRKKLPLQRKKTKRSKTFVKAANPLVWPYETHSKGQPSVRASFVAKTLKKYLTGRDGATREELYKVIDAKAPPFAKVLDKKKIPMWQGTLCNILRNYSNSGYLECVEVGGKVTYKLGK